ncbi:SDR family oxidoreductase [Nakamurella panacisegetis]
MMTNPTYATTGSTGRVGDMVARRLAAAGVAQRLIVRDPSRAPELPGAQISVADYVDPSASTAALTGIKTLFMVSAAEKPDRVQDHFTFIDAAASAGVELIVYLSFFGAAADSTFTLGRDHWATEEHLRSSGIDHVILRDNLYLDFLPGLVGDDGAIRGPAGDGRVAAVAQRDIAEVAASVLLAPDGHRGRTYRLTGPQALTLAEVAATLTVALDRPVRYVAETLEEAYASRAVYGAPRWQLDAWVSTYTAIAAGEMDGVSDDIPALTGHPATSLADLLRS